MAKRDTIAIFPGRFQPPHRGHRYVYEWLVEEFGTAFIATSNVIEEGRSPFSFAEKKMLFEKAGIDADAIREVRSPYIAKEIIDEYGEDNINVVFAVSEKDMTGDPRFNFANKKDGSLSYLQPYSNDIEMESAATHGYIVIAPTFDFDVGDDTMQSATQVRKQFRIGDNAMQIRIVEDLFDVYDKDAHNLLRERLV